MRSEYASSIVRLLSAVAPAMRYSRRALQSRSTALRPGVVLLEALLRGLRGAFFFDNRNTSDWIFLVRRSSSNVSNMGSWWALSATCLLCRSFSQSSSSLSTFSREVSSSSVCLGRLSACSAAVAFSRAEVRNVCPVSSAMRNSIMAFGRVFSSSSLA